jgi:predicted AlkP superfamily phosphohydrolase/phosphomutase/Flp pilus assembly protein TadD
MRSGLVAGALALAVLVAWLTLAWVPEDGAKFAWQADSGVLRVPRAGLAVLPRWSFRRSAAARLAASVEAAALDGGRVTVAVRWRPPTGTYRLQPAGTVGEGLGRAALEAVREIVGRTSLGCLSPALAASADRGCPTDLAADLTSVIADAIGTSSARLRVELTPDAAALRDFVLGELVARLPPPESRILVLGLDGLDWDFVLPLVGQGQMPNLDRLLRAGTWGTLETLVPTLSPLIWTSMATGVPPDRHGILDFVEKDPATGTMVPVTGRSRRVPALWNLASALERTVHVVGWWGSWPAERVNGVMVSDRLYYTLTQGLAKEVLRRDPPDMIYPSERASDFIALRDRAVRETDWPTVRQFMPISEQQFDAAVAADRGMEDPIDGFRRLLAATRTYLGAGLMLAEEPVDLTMVYLEGTDTIGHLLAPYVPPATLDVDPGVAATYVATVPRYFQIVDRWIGRYLQSYPLSETTFLLVSDHGFKWSEGRPRGLSGTAGKTAPLWHDLDAVFLAAGSEVRRLGRIQEPASIYDLAPTVAALLGVPPDVSWQGSVLPGCPATVLEPIDYRPLLPPELYRQAGGGVAPEDPEFIAKLRALGYLGSGAGEAPAADATFSSPPAALGAQPATEATRGELNNLALIKIGEKKYQEAESLLRRAIGENPEYAAPHYNLRRIYMETKRYDDADRQLWVAVDKGLRDSVRTVDRAAADYDNLGLPERSAALLSEALRRYPEHEPFWVHLLVVRIRLEQCAEGNELGRTAAARFPESAPVHAFYGLAAACAGDVAAARRALSRSLELKPDQPMLRTTLAGLQPG